MLFLARKQNEGNNKDQRLVVVTYETQVAFLCLQADCSMDSAIEEMKKMFGIDNVSTVENRGYISQTKETVATASIISQIKTDQHPKARKLQGKVIRLELS